MTDNEDAKNCWEFWDCGIKVRKICPAYISDSGRECWMVAGSYDKHPTCPKVVNKIMNCWECAWYKKLNPQTDKK